MTQARPALAIFFDFVGIAVDGEQRVGVRVKPVDRMRYTLQVSIRHLTHDDVDRVFDSHLLSGPLACLGIFDLQRQDFIANILAKADMQNVARQNIAELSRHIDLVGAIFVYFGGPAGESFKHDRLEGLEHVLKAVTVECVTHSFPFLLPGLIVQRKNEALSDHVLEHEE
eukprot:CAMPEP_0170469556 /NCGR_PEP_ID=MMETSP0123-20130129/12349_1 /TAXON_ID=182087 /ORGANISM="Favella ehrenbergii, Strain Fehren 1" /LENGTH=169 /DNA_ID=CAMNT_0010736469 /DNA_START=867 /DNA_END=1375 /DNA_ORIENTATION=-